MIITKNTPYKPRKLEKKNTKNEEKKKNNAKKKKNGWLEKLKHKSVTMLFKNDIGTFFILNKL